MLLDKFYMFVFPVVNIKISIYREGEGRGGGLCDIEHL